MASYNLCGWQSARRIYVPTTLDQASQRKVRNGIAILSLLLVASAIAAFALDQPAVNSPAPAFKLQNQEGSPVSLDEFKGKWVVLYFYPKDMSSGCTIEAHNFQKDLEKYKQKNAVILGVSMDSVDSHKQFCAKESLNFKLLSDSDRTVSEKYGSVMDYQGQKYSARNTFLIDPAGVIRKVYDKVDVRKHSTEVLADLDQLAKK
jgi:peroxiredoxin Q/BCP